MLSKLKQRKEKGFTIIEVLIVLAIAGLILLVVFLAVPALQRNSRNTQRSNDVAGLLGGMSEYVNNNNGNLPPVATSGLQVGADDTVAVVGKGGSGNTVNVSLGYYTADDVDIINDTSASGDTSTGSQERVRIVLGAECNAAGTGATAGPSRGYVALYTLEDNAMQCRES